jgi:hypothetical protein
VAIVMTLNFAGGQSQTITWSTINIDQNFPERILYFDGKFKGL